MTGNLSPYVRTASFLVGSIFSCRPHVTTHRGRNRQKIFVDVHNMGCSSQNRSQRVGNPSNRARDTQNNHITPKYSTILQNPPGIYGRWSTNNKNNTEWSRGNEKDQRPRDIEKIKRETETHQKERHCTLVESNVSTRPGVSLTRTYRSPSPNLPFRSPSAPATCSSSSSPPPSPTSADPPIITTP